MTTTRLDEGQLRGALRAAQDVRAEQLSSVLTRAGRIQRWLSQPIDSDLRAQLGDDRRRIADEVLELLVGWTDLGGTITLAEADLDATRAAVSGSPRVAPTLEVVAPQVSQIVAEPATTTVLAGPGQVVGVRPRVSAALGAAIVSRPPVATGDSLKSLAKHFEAGAQMRAEGISANWEELLAKIVGDLGAPGDDGEVEVTILQNVVREADRWRGLPREVQRTLVGLVTGRLRRAQDEIGVAGAKLDDTFSMLSAWSKREQPGWVNGLSRGHGPTRGSWSADVEAYGARLPRAEAAPAVRESHERLLSAVAAFLPEFESAPEGAMDAVRAQFKAIVRKALEGGVRPADPRLVKLCQPHVALFEDREFKSLRKALREDAEPADLEDDEKAPPLPPDWAWWGRTRYRRGVLVGGDPRELNRERLERAFGFTELEWVGTEFKRNNLQTIRDRVRAGKLDIVIILGSFVGHDADEVILPAARECAVDWVHVDKGYGIVRVRRAIERFLDPLASR